MHLGYGERRKKSWRSMEEFFQTSRWLRLSCRNNGMDSVDVGYIQNIHLVTRDAFYFDFAMGSRNASFLSVSLFPVFLVSLCPENLSK